MAVPPAVAPAAVVPPFIGGLLPAVVPDPSLVPPALGGGVPLPPPPTAPVPRAELLKIDPLKDPKSFIDSLEQIQFYLRMPEFSPGTVDGVLTTSVSNFRRPVGLGRALFEPLLKMVLSDFSSRTRVPSITAVVSKCFPR